MMYQQNFQTADIPEQTHASCGVYHTGKDGDYPLHCHSFYEISYVIRGERYETRNGTSYSVPENTLIFYPPLAFHSNKNVDETDVVVIQFSTGFLRGNSSKLSDLMILDRPYGEPPTFSPDKNGRVYAILNRLIKFHLENVAPPDYEPSTIISRQFTDNGLILQLLSAMLEENCLTILYGTGVSTQIGYLDTVINHIFLHPEEKIGMKEAARMAHMSYYSFSRFFKEAVGINFSDYSNIIRIRMAEEKLLSTDLPVAEIAAQIGIDTPSYFSALFKSINGLSPLDFRGKNRP